MKLFYCLMISLCPGLCKAQDVASVKALLVGDRLPDVKFKTVVNYKNNTATLKEFKNKLVLLDFWAGYCSACIHKFPLLDSLEKAYPKELSVLLVSSSASDKISNTKSLLARIFKGTRFGLPVVLGDTVLNTIFPHQTIPHYVWLDENSTIVAITGTEDVTADNIVAYMAGKQVSFGQKNVMEKSLDFEKPLPAEYEGISDNNLLGRSLIRNFIPGLSAGSHINQDSKGRVTKIVMINQPVIYLLMTAYHYYDMPGRLQYQPTDTFTNLTGKSDEWITKHSYCYELITPSVSMEKARELMQADLLRWLNVSARTDTATTDCYVLTTDAATLSKFRAAGTKRKLSVDSAENIILESFSMSGLTKLLDDNLTLHVISEAAFGEKIDIMVPPIKDFEACRDALKKYGIILSRSNRRLPNLFIYHNNN